MQVQRTSDWLQPPPDQQSLRRYIEAHPRADLARDRSPSRSRPWRRSSTSRPPQRSTRPRSGSSSRRSTSPSAALTSLGLIGGRATRCVTSRRPPRCWSTNSAAEQAAKKLGTRKRPPDGGPPQHHRGAGRGEQRRLDHGQRRHRRRGGGAREYLRGGGDRRTGTRSSEPPSTGSCRRSRHDSKAVRQASPATRSPPRSHSSRHSASAAIRPCGSSSRRWRPTSPVSPRPVPSILAGILAGLVLGIGAVFALRMIDPRLRREDQIRAQYRLPILARVPQERGRQGPAVALEQPSPRLDRGIPDPACGAGRIAQQLSRSHLDPDHQPRPRRGQDDLGDLARHIPCPDP